MGAAEPSRQGGTRPGAGRPSSPERLERVTTYLPPAVIARLDQAATSSRSDLLRTIVEEWLAARM